MGRPDPNVVRAVVSRSPGKIQISEEAGTVVLHIATDVGSRSVTAWLKPGQAQRLGKRLLILGHHPRAERKCLVCGCTDTCACAVGCSWVSRKVRVCSACAWGQNGNAKHRKARKLLAAAGVDPA